jgi:hypothetical protein
MYKKQVFLQLWPKDCNLLYFKERFAIALGTGIMFANYDRTG